jgi:hypothetical protein
MKRGSTLFLKLVIVLLALVVLTWMVVFPRSEGAAASRDLISIYTDPFVLYLYVAWTPFFVALYQAIRLLGFVEKNTVFSRSAVEAIRKIKYCAIAYLGFIAVAVSYISVMARVKGGDDDPAGFVAIGLVLIFASAVFATAAAVFQKILQNAVDIKSENDLTV